MKVVDFDKLFDEFVAIFLENNKGKYTAKQLENLQPKLYEKFTNLKIKNIGGLTPSQYYESKKDKLLDILKEHVKQDISVNEFLQNAICQFVSESELIENLNEEFDLEYLSEIIDILSLKDSKNGLNRYIDLLLSDRIDEQLTNKLVDLLISDANLVWQELLGREIPLKKKVFVAEILSNVSEKNDAILSALSSMLVEDKNNTPVYCSFLIRYNDERVLDLLYKLIEEDITYDVFIELRNAIEFFGGTYDKARDFSQDKFYKLIKGE